MRVRQILILLSSCLLATIALVAQNLPPDEFYWARRPYTPDIDNAPVIRVQSDLVEVATVVRDAHERPVAGLQKNDFLLYDNGKPQTITTFIVENGPQPAPSAPNAPAGPPNLITAVPVVQPRYVALFFDDMNSSFSDNMSVNKNALNFEPARTSAIKFIRKGLDPGEKVGIFTASQSLTVDFTDDTKKLLGALARLHLFPRRPFQDALSCPPEGLYQAWVIAHESGMSQELQAAIIAAKGCCGPGPGGAESCAHVEAEMIVARAEPYALDTLHSISAVIRYLGQKPGRRVLVIASSGFLTMSFNEEQQKIIKAALDANVVINSMDTAGLPTEFTSEHYNIITPMAILSQGTGGQFFHNQNDLAMGFHTLSAAPSVSYILGFSPDDVKPDGKLHNLKVKLAEPKGFSVEARPGYYAPSAEPTPAEKRFARLQQSVMAADSPTEIPIEFTAVPEKLPSGESSLKIAVHVDVRKLPFEQMVGSAIGTRQVERLIFITAIFDAKNKFVTGVEGVMDLRLKDATLKQVSSQGLNAELSLQAPAGSYRLRQVVQEAVNGRLTAVNRPVEIR